MYVIYNGVVKATRLVSVNCQLSLNGRNYRSGDRTVGLIELQATQDVISVLDRLKMKSY